MTIVDGLVLGGLVSVTAGVLFLMKKESRKVAGFRVWGKPLPGDAEFLQLIRDYCTDEFGDDVFHNVDIELVDADRVTSPICPTGILPNGRLVKGTVIEKLPLPWKEELLVRVARRGPTGDWTAEESALGHELVLHAAPMSLEEPDNREEGPFRGHRDQKLAALLDLIEDEYRERQLGLK